MTDPETANRTYIGPMTPELVETIIAKARHRPRCALLRAQATAHQPSLPARQWACCSLRRRAVADASPRRRREQEKPDALLPTMGGQTALNLAVALAEVRCMVSRTLRLPRVC